MLKRIFWFVLTNIAFMVTIGLVLSGISFLFPNLIDMNAVGNNKNIMNIFIYAGIVGFTSAFISLALSKPIAKWTTDTIVIDSNTTNEMERFLLTKVQQQAIKLGFKMPEVGIYQDNTPNAFATGMTKNSSLVSFSSGLLNNMNHDEIEGVIAHEMSHIENGDMVTLTLIQGVVNTFVIAISRILTNLAKNTDNSFINNPISLLLINMGLQIFLGLLTTPIVAYFSRLREYRADAGAANLVGNYKMIAALSKLKTMSDVITQQGKLEQSSAMAASGITENGISGWKELFSTHPSLDKRIEALK